MLSRFQSMNKRETEDHIVKCIDSFMTERGFKHKRSVKIQVEYYRKVDNGFDKFSLSTNNYYDEHMLDFGFGKRLDVVEDIVSQVNQILPFTNPPLQEGTTTFGFGYNSYNGINKDGCFDYMKTEADIEENVGKIIEFTEQEALPFLERLRDLRDVDAMINGNGEDWWETDWKKPFGLGGYFYVRRLIIARLSGRSDYEDFINRMKAYSEGRMAEQGKTIDWHDHSNHVPLAMHLLESVAPLY